MEFFKITIPLLLIIHFTSTTEGYDSTKFYQSDRKQVYYIENEYTHDWFQSMAACARMNMTMLAIESRAKSEEVNRLILKTFGKNVVLWVGGYAVGPSRQYTWIATGEPFVYTFWNPNQPDFAKTSEYCAQIGWGAQMQWNDHHCTSKFGYICEYPARTICECERSDRNPKYANMTLQFHYHA